MKKKLSVILSLLIMLSCFDFGFQVFAKGDVLYLDVSLSESSIELLYDDYHKENTFKLSATVDGEPVISTKWNSSSPSVATVENDGTVTAKGLGETVITFTAQSEDFTESAECIVKVRKSLRAVFDGLKYNLENIPEDIDETDGGKPLNYTEESVNGLRDIFSDIQDVLDKDDTEAYSKSILSWRDSFLEKVPEMEDTEENCDLVKNWTDEIDTARNVLKNSGIAHGDDRDFWKNWNDALNKLDSLDPPFSTDNYTEASCKAVNDILDEQAAVTVWLNNKADKEKLDALAKRLSDAVDALKVHTENISIVPSTLTLSYGDAPYPLECDSDGYDEVIWTSSAPDIVSVSSKGVITVLRAIKDEDNAEYVDIFAKSNGKAAVCSVYIKNPLSKITLSPNISAFVGTQKTITPFLEGADSTAPVTDTETLLWESDDTDVATVENGVVTPKAPGSCTIKVSYGKITASCNLTVLDQIRVTSLKKKTAPSYLAIYVDSPDATDARGTVKIEVSPSSASIRELEWTSSNEGILKIEDPRQGTGSDRPYAIATLVGVSAGTATVTYKTTDGSDLSGSFDVTVLPFVSSLTLDKTQLMLYIGDTEKHEIKPSCLPLNAGNQVIYWQSSNEDVATVAENGSANGVINVRSTGSTVITANTTDGSGIRAYCNVTVMGRAKSMNINKSSLSMKTGETFKLSAWVETEEVSEYYVEDWTVSDETIAKIGSDGVIKALLPGKVKVTAKYFDGTLRTCLVTITADLKGISLPGTLTMAVNKSKTVTPTYNPSYASEKSVTWSSDNDKVASVTTGGTITANSVGTANITAVSKQGGFTAKCKVVVIQPVEGVTLNHSQFTLIMKTRPNVKLTSGIIPSNATTKGVTWKSGNTAVAVVSETGYVTAKGPGTCKITVTTNDGGFKESCTITVVQPVSGISFKPSTVTFYVGQKEIVAPVFSPANASNKNATYTSSNKSVATVNASTGLVTALKTGSCTITAKSKNGGFTAKYTLKVVKKVNVTGVKLNSTNVTVNKGKKLTLKATVLPSNASVKKVTWSSSNSNIASVDSNGIVTGKKGGNVVITCKTNDQGKTVKCNVKVYEQVDAVNLSITSATITSGKTKTLTATVVPSTATNKALSWWSTNKSVATVTSDGKITAVAGGECIITVASKDDNAVRATCRVTVIQAPKQIVFEQYEATVLTGDSFIISATVKPANSYDKSVKWSSNNSLVAKVSQKGVVTGVSTGEAVITCTSAVDQTVKRTFIVTVKQPVTGISLSASNITLVSGKTKTLVPNVKPKSATDKSVKYKTDNASVARVNSKGVVTAVGPGSCTITVTTNDGFFFTKCKVNVIEQVVSVSLNKKSMNLIVGKSASLTATVKPSNATNPDVKWSSSNSLVVRVTQSGKITALKVGKAVITCTSIDGGFKATCTVNAIIGIDAVSLNKGAITLKKDAVFYLKPKIYPADATITTVKWTSSNTKVAVVDSNGKVTALKKGTAVITCTTTQGSFKASCTVTVT